MALPSAIDVDHRFASLLGGWQRVNPRRSLVARMERSAIRVRC
jgi:hypothetical protein